MTSSDQSRANEPLLRKLDEMAARYTSLQESLNDPALLTNPQKLVATSKEAGQLETIVGKYREYQKADENVKSLQTMTENKADAEMAERVDMGADMHRQLGTLDVGPGVVGRSHPAAALDRVAPRCPYRHKERRLVRRHERRGGADLMAQVVDLSLTDRPQ